MRMKRAAAVLSTLALLVITVPAASAAAAPVTCETALLIPGKVKVTECTDGKVTVFQWTRGAWVRAFVA